MIDPFEPECLFGRHVAQRADRARSAAFLRFVLESSVRDSEIEHLRLDASSVVAGQYDVLRLQISMHDPARVHRSDSTANRKEQTNAVFRREGALLRQIFAKL